MMVQIFPTIATALKCFQRIQDFLNSECQKDHRLTLGSPATSPESGSSPSEANADLLVVLDASIGWSTTEPALLHNLNFTVKTGKTVFVIGPVGVGKSTLLKAMIGEAVLKQGFVYTGALHAAYVDQTPWIQNASVRDNVLGISIYDATWYDTVVKACALDYDISKMAKGDRTLVGSGGISLSGGQKQRLALARAVYSKHKLILIDDAFSGLDLGTEERLFSRLLGPRGLLRETTVVLVTHAVHRLSYSDHIISLDSTGHIIEQGSYEHLVQGTGYVSTLTSNLHGRKVSADQVELEDPVCTEAKALVDATAVEVEVQTDTRASGDVQTWLYYFGALGNWRTVIYGILAVITGASMGFQNLVLTFWSNAIDAQGQEVNRMYLGLLGGVTAFSYISTLVLAW
jgi:ATP-binding cassette subfamily C (CFTR/MRP) protein 1